MRIIAVALAIILSVPIAAHALTAPQRKVLVMWIRQASDADLVTFIEGTNAEKVATLKAFAADRKVALEQRLAAYNATVAQAQAEGTARAAELADVSTVAGQ